MKYLIILTLISFNLYSLNIRVSEVKIGNKVLKLSDNSLDFKENYIGIDDIEDNLNLSISVMVNGNLDRIELEYKDNNILTTSNPNDPLVFSLDAIFNTISGESDSGKFKIDLIAYYNNIGQTTSETLNLNFYYDNKKPTYPNNIKAKSGNKNIKLSWKSVDDAEAYKVYYKKVDGGNEKTKLSNDTSIQISSLENGSEYEFRVASIDKADNKSDKSAALKATPVDSEDFFEYYKNSGGEEAGCFFGPSRASHSPKIWLILFAIAFGIYSIRKYFS